MDTRELTEILRATIDPNQRQQAEEQLHQIHKIIGFAPSLLQVVMHADVDMPVRQAGVICLKNLVTQHWADKERGEAGQPIPFSVHEQDRAMIRDAIVDAVVHSPDLIRVQLSLCVSSIVKHDFPGRWTQIVDKISIYLQNPDASGWSGALLCLYQLVKNFEFKKPGERTPLNEAMNLLFPMIYQLCLRLLPDQSEQSVLLQKQILKIYFALTQYSLPLDLISREAFSQWMEIVRAIADRPVPEQTNVVEEDDRMDLPWWKCKKWALHIMHRMFERYGSPGKVTKEYKEFAEWYLVTFSGGILEVLLKILDQYRNKIYISPRVIQQTLNYVNLAVSHAYSWKFLKPHMFLIIQDVLFPLLSHSKADEELWNSDPYEYIRVTFDIFEDFVSPVTAAQTLLHSACKKRKGMLPKTMGFVMEVLTSPNADPRQKDGALHMVGALAEILLKTKFYKEQMDKMICQYVFPEFSSPHGHMRARACWVLHYFSEIKFRQEGMLAEAVRLTTNALLSDGDLPVKVQAAVAIQMLLTYQDKAKAMLEPQIKNIALEILNIIRETENDDLTTVMQKIVYLYTEQLMSLSVEICQHLATTFAKVMDTDEGSDEKAITAMGLLNTVETLLTVMEDHPGIMAQLQPIVLQVIGLIFSQSVMEFFEEALSLVYNLTSKSISPDMWKVLEMIYNVFQKDGFDYFTDMMPALHNYVTVDTPAFLSNENHVLAIFNMCKAILNGDAGEDPECHAAKLLEVIILQCKGQIDQCIPTFVELVLTRLMREVKTSELRTMCLQVVIAALYYNPSLLFDALDKVSVPLPADASTPALPSPDSQQTATSPAPPGTVTAHFVKQWIHDTDCFLGLHDRKLCVLGLCTLVNTPGCRPNAVTECAPQIIPSLILLFDGLKRAYAAKAQEEEEEEDDEVEDTDLEDQVLDTDEDDNDDVGPDYLERVQDRVAKASANSPFNVVATIQDEDTEDDSDDDDDEEYDPSEETALESYTTPLDEENCTVDEYVVFKEVLHSIQASDPSWYQILTSQLTMDQQRALQEVFLLADQRKAAAESKRIEQGGGYVFHQQTVPTSFNFGGTPLGR